MTREDAIKTVTEALLVQADRWCLDEDKAAGIAAYVVGALGAEPDLELARLRDENRMLCDYIRAAAGDESCLLPVSTLELMGEDRARVGERLRVVEQAATDVDKAFMAHEPLGEGPLGFALHGLHTVLHGEPPIETRPREASGPREYVRWVQCPRRSDRAEGCRPTARPPDESSPPS